MRGLSFCLLLLGGCMSMQIDETRLPPADWPQLEVRVHRVDDQGIRDSCKAVPFNPFSLFLTGGVMGCADVNFLAKTCDVYVMFDLAIEHERAHCAGYSHVGSTWAEDRVRYWRSRGWRPEGEARGNL